MSDGKEAPDTSKESTSIDKGLLLIVDDENVVVEMLVRIFSSKGYRTLTAFSGGEAIEKARQGVPDLILLDLGMPGINGFDALKILRSQPITERIPIILVSARTGVEYIIKALELGADDYIAKPFQFTELELRVEARLRASYLRLPRRKAEIDKRSPIFISYTRLDWDGYVKPLVTRLEAERLPFWVDQTSIEGSDDWLDAVNKALKIASRMMVCVSPDALSSRYVKMAYRYAFNNGIRLYPIICRPVDLPAELQILQSYTYTELDRLVEALKKN